MFGRKKIDVTRIETANDLEVAPVVVSLEPTQCLGVNGCSRLTRIHIQDLHDLNIQDADTSLANDLRKCDAIPGCLFGEVVAIDGVQNA